jgi:hypothetical protein
MEFYNPIHDMTDLIGRWEGNIEKDETKLSSAIIFNHHGSDIIQYKHKIKSEKEENIVETGFFFFDKLKEELLHIVINEEGYVENNTSISTKKTKLLKISSTFVNGYNLPPNMEIKRDYKLKIEEKSLEIDLKMGKEASIVSKGIYHRK